MWHDTWPRGRTRCDQRKTVKLHFVIRTLNPNQLTPWSSALLENPPFVHLLKNFPRFYGTRRFITVITRALHWSLSSARSMQSIPSHPIGRAIVQAGSRWLPTAAARVRARVRSCGIWGGQSGTGAGVLRVLRFPLPIFIPPIAPQSLSSIIWGWPSGLRLTPRIPSCLRSIFSIKGTNYLAMLREIRNVGKQPVFEVSLHFLKPYTIDYFENISLQFFSPNSRLNNTNAII
jgi:hypothetical protein